MNPYGLRTDQLSAYLLSGHGRRLQYFGDDRVAVCIDCHGSHDIRRADSPESRTHFQKIVDTCGRCHADAALMRDYGRSASIVEQYRASVHGRNVLERGDSGSPTCATCHGSHGAAPPGAAEVGHVCGRCHQQVEQHFEHTLHARLPLFPRCIGCHAGSRDVRDHGIEEAGLPPDRLVQTYVAVRREFPLAPDTGLRTHFGSAVDDLEHGPRLSSICERCHAEGRSDPHGQFLSANDPEARQRGRLMAEALTEAQFEYARTAERVQRVARGVVLVRQQALRAEDAKSELVALMAAIHTMDLDDIRPRVTKIKAICGEIHASLDDLERGLAQRYVAMAGLWGFVVVFGVLMYRKYLDLRRIYVRRADEPATGAGTGSAAPERRRFLNAALSVLGGVGVGALVYPAVAYLLPAHKRSGAGERVSAGQEEGWAVWELKKVSVSGKAVGVVRTDSGYRAFSLVCTHLGCIVLWNGGKREFECPCHAARFDLNGKVLAGPPPTPLPEYNVAVAQGEVVVSVNTPG